MFIDCVRFVCKQKLDNEIAKKRSNDRGKSIARKTIKIQSVQSVQSERYQTVGGKCQFSGQYCCLCNQKFWAINREFFWNWMLEGLQIFGCTVL